MNGPQNDGLLRKDPQKKLPREGSRRDFPREDIPWPEDSLRKEPLRDAPGRANPQEDDPQPMTFGEHLEALRPHLVRSVVVLALGIVAAFCCKRWLVDGLLFGPLRTDFPTNRLILWLADRAGVDYALPAADRMHLVNTTLAGQLNLHLRLSFTAALVCTLPYLLWELWRFVRPALTPRERALCRSTAGGAALAALAGLAFGYFVLAPLSIAFLASYSVSDAVRNLIGIGSYLSTVVQVTLASALLFQLPLGVRLLTRMGLLTAARMRRYRRHAIVVLALLAALITPPDAFTMLLVLLPLAGLYQYGIRVAERTERRR